MTAPRDITGQRFGRLVAVRDVGHDGRRRLWLFRCDCGETITRSTRNLARINARGQTANCGCFIGGTKNKGRRTNVTHDMSRTRLYGVWAGVLDRCRNPKNRRYKDYGGRGITVCAAWMDAGSFLVWAMSNGYKHGLQIDRIDNDQGYEPGNCRFVTPKENMANRRPQLRKAKRGFFGRLFG